LPGADGVDGRHGLPGPSGAPVSTVSVSSSGGGGGGVVVVVVIMLLLL